MAEEQVVMSSIEERVKDIVVEQLGLERDKVSLESKFADDLGADSLDTVELVMALEEEFDIEIPDNLLGRKTFQSIQFIADVVNQLKS